MSDVRSWAKQFIEEEPNDELVPALHVLLSKQALWDTASDPLANGRWPEAEAILNKILQIDPNDANAHLNMGAICRNTGDLDSSLEHYRLCETAFGNDALLYTNRARTYEALGRKQEAISDYKRALEMIPGDAFTLERLAELGELVEMYTDLRDPTSKRYVSTEDYEAMVLKTWESRKSDIAYLAQQSRGCLEDNRPNLALAAAELALAADPRCSEAWLTKGVALWRLARHEEAKSALFTYNDLVPDSGWGYCNIAKVVWDQGGREAALPYLKQGLDKDPNILNALGMLVLPDEQQDVEEAIVRTEEIRARYPEAWAPWRMLGDLHHRAGRTDEAIRAYGEAVKRNADDETLAGYLGLLGQSGRAAEAAALVDDLPDVGQHSVKVQYNAVQSYVETGRAHDARRLLKAMADDVSLPPKWRQDFRERLESLEDS